MLAFEAGRLLQAMGGEVRSFDPAGLPLPDAVGATHPKVQEVPKVWQQFDEAGRMKPSPLYERLVDVAEERFKFTLLARDVAPYLVDR